MSAAHPSTSSGQAKAILRASLGALVVAAIVVAGAVLPAEFGIDPLGTGRALGLLALYDAAADPAAAPLATGSEGDPPPRPRDYRVDSRELALAPGQSFEFKYQLAAGTGMVYAWTVNGKVKFEFHGEPFDRARPVVSYEKGEADYASGSLTAAFTGIHGWFWENVGPAPVVITVKSAGFFTTAEEFRSRWDPERKKTRIEQTTYDLR